jgi:hypothetical protein
MVIYSRKNNQSEKAEIWANLSLQFGEKLVTPSFTIVQTGDQMESSRFSVEVMGITLMSIYIGWAPEYAQFDSILNDEVLQKLIDIVYEESLEAVKSRSKKLFVKSCIDTVKSYFNIINERRS